MLRLDEVQRQPGPAESIQFFLEQPDTPYVAIALVEVSNDGWDLSLEKLRDKLASEAAKLRGDVVSHTSEEGGTYLAPVGDGFMALPMSEKELTGRVIVLTRRCGPGPIDFSGLYSLMTRLGVAISLSRSPRFRHPPERGPRLSAPPDTGPGEARRDGRPWGCPLRSRR